MELRGGKGSRADYIIWLWNGTKRSGCCCWLLLWGGRWILDTCVGSFCLGKAGGRVGRLDGMK